MDNTVALKALERRLADLERKGNALVEVINDLRAETGLPPLPPFGSGRGDVSQSGVTSDQISNIQPDTFYGKKLQTAVREYLEMRRAANLGPAKPREIYEALKEGGYQSDAKDDNVAMVSLRAMLRKRSQYFHKLPNGTYGLTAWYKDLRPPKDSKPQDDKSSDSEENALEDSNISDDGESEAADNPKESSAA